MILTPVQYRRAVTLSTTYSGDRIYLDQKGIRHIRPAQPDFEAAVRQHAALKGHTIAESLVVLERLREMRVVDPATLIGARGAVFQTFSGKGNRQGCHAMPCQLLLGGRYPHQLTPPDGNRFSRLYVGRIVEMFARCTWSPISVNRIDSILEHSAEAGFVSKYLQAVSAVLEGDSARGAYHDMSNEKRRVLNGLVEQLEDHAIGVHDAMVLLGALSSESGAEPASSAEVERLLADEQAIERIAGEREVIIRTYAEREEVSPRALESGELQAKVNAEAWEEG